MVELTTIIKAEFDLSDSKQFDEHIGFLKENVSWERAYEALRVIPIYEQWLEKHPSFITGHPEKTEIIRTLLVDNRWIALRMISHDEVLELYKQHILNVFTIEDRYDEMDGYSDLPKMILHEYLRAHLLTIRILDDRDEFKHAIINALTRNQEPITSAPYFADIKETTPTLANWFAEYIEFMVPDVRYSQFQQSKFFKTNENILRLSNKELHRLRLLFDLYERLRISSWRPTGMEESLFYDGEQGVGVVQYEEIIPYAKEDQERIKKAMQHIQQQQAKKDAANPPAARPPVDQVRARPTVHPDIEGLDMDSTEGPDHFSKQDDEEIFRHEEKSNILTKVDPQYENRAHALKDHLQVSFQTPEVEKKFTALLVSVLRGLRDVMELRSYLEELKYSKKQIEHIVDGVKAEIKGDIVPAKQRESATAERKTERSRPTFSQLQQQVKTVQKRYSASQDDVDDAAVESTTVKPQPVAAVNERKHLLPKLRRPRRQKKQLIDDVKIQESMVMSPIDELRAMDLIEYRRLSPNPAEAAMKLRDKIFLLGDDSVAKQAEGVQAFKTSSLNKQFLDIGNRSMSEGRSVTDVIVEMQKSGIPVLSVEEFNAVADLNKQLRF